MHNIWRSAWFSINSCLPCSSIGLWQCGFPNDASSFSLSSFSQVDLESSWVQIGGASALDLVSHLNCSGLLGAFCGPGSVLHLLHRLSHLNSQLSYGKVPLHLHFIEWEDWDSVRLNRFAQSHRASWIGSRIIWPGAHAATPLLSQAGTIPAQRLSTNLCCPWTICYQPTLR